MKNFCSKPRLTVVALATRCIMVGALLFWMSVGAAVWWLCIGGPAQ
ncbi:hypothetical protein [Novosphingobium sp.]|nr:hypothetical protein [Novosphingobium sp.]